MTDRPILFSGPMVRALLAGTKTQTRRLLVERYRREPGAPEILDRMFRDDPASRVRVTENGGLAVDTHGGVAGGIAVSPYGVPGDRLWVRETHALWDPTHDAEENARNARELDVAGFSETQLAFWRRRIVYKADADTPTREAHQAHAGGAFHWRPSIFCKRWMSRITLEVTEVRVERLQDISEADARAEGVVPLEHVGADQWVDTVAPARTFGTHPHVGAYAVLWDSLNTARAPWASNPYVWVVSFKRVP